MTTRTLVDSSTSYLRYEVKDDAGKVLGYEDEPILRSAETNRELLRQKAAEYLAQNEAFLGASGPVTLVTLSSHMQRLAKQNNVLTRLILGLLDSTSGT